MIYVDFTHPDIVPDLKLRNAFRSAEYYTRLEDLPPDHKFHYRDWILFRYPVWLEAGAAWVHSIAIFEKLKGLASEAGVDMEEFVPIVGSEDPGYDEALAQSLKAMGLNPKVAEIKKPIDGQGA